MKWSGGQGTANQSTRQTRRQAAGKKEGSKTEQDVNQEQAEVTYSRKQGHQKDEQTAGKLEAIGLYDESRIKNHRNRGVYIYRGRVRPNKGVVS